MHDGQEQAGCILFFVKYPERGKVKTRLGEVLDEGSAVQLYRQFVTDVLSTLESTGYPIIVCYTPADRETAFREWLGDWHRYLPQRGRNLGERIKHGFADVFAEGFDNALAVGSDSPDLPSSFLHEAFAHLEKNHVVIGPAVDGGYYLIGFTRSNFFPAAFDGIEWSTSTVCAETMRKIRAGRPEGDIHLLPAWKDVDTLADLRALHHRNRKSPRVSSDTMRSITHYLL